MVPRGAVAQELGLGGLPRAELVAPVTRVLVRLVHRRQGLVHVELGLEVKKGRKNEKIKEKKHRKSRERERRGEREREKKKKKEPAGGCF